MPVLPVLARVPECGYSYELTWGPLLRLFGQVRLCSARLVSVRPDQTTESRAINSSDMLARVSQAWNRLEQFGQLSLDWIDRN